MILINSLDCGVSKKGTGLIDCFQELGKPSGFLDVGADFELDVQSGALDLSTINDLIKAGSLTPFTNAVDFADNSEDSVIETFSAGTKVKVRSGLPEFEFTYVNGYNWHKSAYSHNGFGGAIILVWENGVLGFDTSADGTKIKGLRRGLLDVKTFSNNDGSATSKTMITLQLLNADAYNSSMALLNEASMGFGVDEIKGAVDTSITIVGTPAVTDTEIVVSVSPSANSSIGIGGAVVGDFTVTGQTVSGVAYDATTKQYTLTVDSLTAGEKTVSLGTSGDVAVEIASVLYSGSSPAFTVA